MFIKIIQNNIKNKYYILIFFIICYYGWEYQFILRIILIKKNLCIYSLLKNITLCNIINNITNKVEHNIEHNTWISFIV